MTRTIANGTTACRLGPALLIALLLALAWAARPVMAAEPAAQFAQLDPRYDYDRARDMREAEVEYQQKAAKLAYARDKELREAAADRAKEFAEARRDYEERMARGRPDKAEREYRKRAAEIEADSAKRRAEIAADYDEKLADRGRDLQKQRLKFYR